MPILDRVRDISEGMSGWRGGLRRIPEMSPLGDGTSGVIAGQLRDVRAGAGKEIVTFNGAVDAAAEQWLANRAGIGRCAGSRESAAVDAPISTDRSIRLPGAILESGFSWRLAEQAQR